MEFNYIRNRIREFSLDSLLIVLIKFLKRAELPNSPYIAIWDIFLLLKWSLEFAGDRYPAKSASEQDVLKLLSYITELQNQNRFNKPTDEIHKLLTVIAYQQSYLQLSVWMDCFSRQILLFSTLKSRYSVQDVFEKETGLKIEEFIVFTFLLWVYTNPETLRRKLPYNGIVQDDFIEIAAKIYPKDKVIFFLELLSVDQEKAKQIAIDDKRIKSRALQPFEITIFTLHPILQYNGKRILLHKKILNYTTNFFIYDFLKKIDNERFTEEFGKRIEKYVELGLKEVSLSYKTENQLRQIFSNSSKVVDFLIDDEILVECKAIELSPYPNVNPDNEVLLNWLKSSIVKAYSQQMMTMANKLNNNSVKYGIIITYKEVYFGNGKDAWDSFLQKPTIEFANANNLNIDLLPPENLFFIDIRTWDLIIQVIKEGKASLKEILKKVAINDSKTETRNFWFHMHLKEYDLGPFNLSYIEEGFRIFKIIDSNQGRNI